MHYGVILNDTASMAKIGPLDAAPYKGAPVAPVLYLKPANTLLARGAAVEPPFAAESVEVGATVGLVIGRPAARLGEAEAMEAVAEIVLAADLSLPHDSVYRPPIREKCFDGSLVLGPRAPVSALAGLELVTRIGGVEVERFALSTLLRSPARLLAEVSDFMTFSPGDVLFVGVRHRAAEARLGDTVVVAADGLGSLSFAIAGGRA